MKIKLILLILFSSFVTTFAQGRPNILWITSEDNGISWVSCYGSKNAKTPNIDQLADEGFRYRYCFDNAAVCAPTRNLWITGMYSVSLGTQPMRSRNSIPHDQIKYYPDLLKEAGYFVSNCSKTDYNIGGREDKACWDEAKQTNAWRLRKKGQPFFSVVNIGASHESRAHGSVEHTTAKPEDMSLFAYHPDIPDMRKTYAKYADAIAKMDRRFKETIGALKADGLYEDTIVVYNSDHGGVMPRSKRFLYSSGIHCPLIVRIPSKFKQLYPADKPGTTVDRLVSFIDMPKTWLSLAGARIPAMLQGKVFLGAATEKEAEYHFAFRERADQRIDNVRLMRDKRFSYHKNYMPYAPAGQYLGYLWKAKGAAAWERHHLDGKTNEITGRFFRPRVPEEFYDNQQDFDNVHNLIDTAEHQSKIEDLKLAMRKKQLEVYDSGLLPEAMRSRRAKANGLTIYEMVRDPKLYPLERYLDQADIALEVDMKNVDHLLQALKDSDEGIRWWAIVGLNLLGKQSRPVWQQVERALNDPVDEIAMMAAWTLVKMGKREQGVMALGDMLFGKCGNVSMLHNIIDWMGEPALPLVKKHLENGGETMAKYGVVSILGHIGELNGYCLPAAKGSEKL
jgi:arylsulfatase A-like enzyme